jgi:anthranilate/para-aminobenzoate synthase component I
MSNAAIQKYRKEVAELGDRFNSGFIVDLWAKDYYRYGVNPEKVISGQVNSKEWDQFKTEMKSIPQTNSSNSGWFVLLGYDCAKAFEKLPDEKQEGQGVPDFWAGYFTDIKKVFPTDEGALDIANFKVENPCPKVGESFYKNGVEAVKEYVFAGDIFQANIAHPIFAKFSGSPLSLYSKISSYNPSPYGAFFEEANLDFSVVSNSPELLFDRQHNLLRAKPIAGTRKRGKDSEQDQEFKEELKSVVKEQAEHLMLVDLARNDIGRVSKPATVKVPLYGDVETYKNVHHLVSTVTGEAKENLNTFEMLEALFPGGTITGAPKIRSIEIINELESHKREFYTGSMGIVSSVEDQEWNILIRTAQIKEGQLKLSVGAGIVADSEPEAEYKETLNKAAAWQKTFDT